MEKKQLFTGKMNLELKKRIMKCLVWSVALYAAETGTLTQTDRRLEASEMLIWITEKVNWLDKVPNELVLRRVNTELSLWQWKHRRVGHVLRHSSLLQLTEGRMRGKAKEGG